jgi:thiamine pyrophosphate-dependent acetolactate synthase large subunit-like protein
VLGDGDYLMGASALWTAARYRIPLLVVVANNRSYYNDEIHQDRVARARARPVGNAHVGMRIHDPDPDVAALATSLGLTGRGPVTDPDALLPTLRDAVAVVRDGGQAVVDVHVERAYPSTCADPSGSDQAGSDRAGSDPEGRPGRGGSRPWPR